MKLRSKRLQEVNNSLLDDLCGAFSGGARFVLLPDNGIQVDLSKINSKPIIWENAKMQKFNWNTRTGSLTGWLSECTNLPKGENLLFEQMINILLLVLISNSQAWYAFSLFSKQNYFDFWKPKFINYCKITL